MPFRVSGKNLDIGEALRERVSARIVEALSKYFDGGYSGHVTVEKEGFGFRTEEALQHGAQIDQRGLEVAPAELPGRQRRFQKQAGARHGRTDQQCTTYDDDDVVTEAAESSLERHDTNAYSSE